MSSQAQILANCRNAQRSTGPKTEEGKAMVSQNAVKHGLSAATDVIRGEDAAEFDRHRKELIADLTPVGGMETVLVERIVSISWRLRRVQRMQNMTFEALVAEGGRSFRGEARWWVEQNEGPPQGREALITDLAVGRAIKEDFACTKVLERLLAYEGRIEGSLYKAMAELERFRRLPKSQAREQTPTFNPLPSHAEEPNAQNKANCPAGHLEGSAPPTDAEQSQSTRVDTTAQNKPNSQPQDGPVAPLPAMTGQGEDVATAPRPAEAEADVQNKANSPVPECVAAASATETGGATATQPAAGQAVTPAAPVERPEPTVPRRPRLWCMPRSVWKDQFKDQLRRLPPMD